VFGWRFGALKDARCSVAASTVPGHLRSTAMDGVDRAHPCAPNLGFLI